jgi:hypothetical protein
VAASVAAVVTVVAVALMAGAVSLVAAVAMLESVVAVALSVAAVLLVAAVAVAATAAAVDFFFGLWQRQRWQRWWRWWQRCHSHFVLLC